MAIDHESAVSDPMLFRFGAIADIQYADIDDATDWRGVQLRRYRKSLEFARAAVARWRQEKIEFIVQLGDIIDGKSHRALQTSSNFSAVFDLLSSVNASANVEDPSPPCSIFSCIGNHELYNFKRGHIPPEIANAKERFERRNGADDEPALPSSSSSRVYYSIDVHPGWRILVLDSFDVSILGHSSSEVDSAPFSLAQRLLANNNPNDLSSRTTSWLQGMKGLDMRFTPLGGGCSERQLQWIQEERDRAKRDDCRVIVACHIPLHPNAAHESNIAWNYDEILDALGIPIKPSRSGTDLVPGVVAAVFAGHDHGGGFVMDDYGVPHFTLNSPLEAMNNSEPFATVDVHRASLRVKWTMGDYKVDLPPM